MSVGFITIFPILYIPKLSTVVFKHKGISWEWAVVFIAAFLFIMGVEFHKWVKRVYFRRQARQSPGGMDPEMRMFEKYTSFDLRDNDVEKA